MPSDRIAVISFAPWIVATRWPVSFRSSAAHGNGQPGALKWLKKNNEIGMPTAIKDITNAVAELRQSTPEGIYPNGPCQLFPVYDRWSLAWPIRYFVFTHGL